jgi:tRNA-dependent cyclodipeptide synthase
MISIAEDTDATTLLASERYKAKVAFVSPLSKRHDFEKESTCFLGVSLENRNFTKKRFHAIVEWAARRFDTCIVLVGDHIHRLTLQSLGSLTEDVARSRAEALGRDFMRENSCTIDAYRHLSDFSYVTCTQIQASNEYAQFHAGLQDYFRSHSAFRESVEGFGRNYHRHLWERLPEQERKRRLGLSCAYFLEEFAVFACLAKRGCKVMAYPGAFSTLAEICAGQFPGILKELQQLIVVSLQLKRR